MNCPLTWFQVVQLVRDGFAGLGFVLGLMLWRRLDRAYRLIAWWLLIAGATDVVAINVGCHDPAARRLVIQFWFPMSAPLVLGALGAMQGTVTRRDVFRLTGLGYVFIWAFLVLRIEAAGEYPKYTAELHTLLLIGAALLTLLRRASLARHDLRHDPGFLLSSALLVFAIPTLFLSKIARLWGATHTEWLHAFFGLQAVISTISFLVIILGMMMTAQRAESVRSG